MHPLLLDVTERIRQRSKATRAAYLAQTEQAVAQGPVREQLSCTNLAHDYAASPDAEKLILKQNHRAANIAIISAYNDVLSAHAPYRDYPQQLKKALAASGHVGQMAGGVPAMCDGVTQGQTGMELSLFSRDVIALSTAVAMSHQVFDGMLLLGICDKIVPGLLMAALRFGHLPAVFVPAGPMPSGISNNDKAKVRQAYAAGEVGRDELLQSEMASYHSAGTCTFYGTANSNQMLMEIMGLQLPGSSFINPNDPLRAPLTAAAAQRVSELTALAPDFMPLGQMVDERTLVNAMVGLLATGGSTNHSIHLPAIGRMAGVIIDWQDMADLSDVVPLLTRVYPNGKADINAFQQSGGMAYLMRELASAGLLHTDVKTIMGDGLEPYFKEPYLNSEGTLGWRPAVAESLDLSVLAPAHAPFMREGGMKLLQGNLGRAIMKVSAVPDDRWQVEAPARVFTTQEAVLTAYHNGELNCDVVVVLKYQGPKANGMPELHQLTPALTNLQDAGYRVALVTDGRLSGASGKVPAAIHVCPEAYAGGWLDRVQDGDVIRLDGHHGELTVLAEGFAQRPAQEPPVLSATGVGRELFAGLRKLVTPADQGALSVGWD
ncbi:phosphogluconate dehydratase [Thalassolituus hydrocarboniclasticus]|uniref:Phosphogluconate dehydratase n=1 Tax=Thalassolituus hydrocarboniclasticus TaxID=2742796 RepID=A0ABY6ABB0_9GAMM|nr:phosphogluconate dehydratase [Thalassolituus hydrocarboniclasticus]UXD87873.1 phosphogluconate dehydratase [Thalassolituus hydrocarboniclasticus]